MSHNRLQDGGAGQVMKILYEPGVTLETLNIGYNGIEVLRIGASADATSDGTIPVQHLVLDGNVFKTWNFHRMGVILNSATHLVTISMQKCLI